MLQIGRIFAINVKENLLWTDSYSCNAYRSMCFQCFKCKNFRFCFNCLRKKENIISGNQRTVTTKNNRTRFGYITC